jgi:nucleotide-binding universal stress UspA family protein
MEVARILVCVDGSRASLEAARGCIDLAARWHSRMRAVYVVEREDIDGGGEAVRVERLRRSGESFLARIVALGEERGLEVERAVLEGVPFEVILDDARRWKADLIVMGRMGRAGPGRALLGSEAERVLEFTDRPVLIVPTTEAATQG